MVYDRRLITPTLSRLEWCNVIGLSKQICRLISMMIMNICVGLQPQKVIFILWKLFNCHCITLDSDLHYSGKAMYRLYFSLYKRLAQNQSSPTTLLVIPWLSADWCVTTVVFYLYISVTLYHDIPAWSMLACCAVPCPKTLSQSFRGGTMNKRRRARLSRSLQMRTRGMKNLASQKGRMNFVVTLKGWFDNFVLVIAGGGEWFHPSSCWCW